MLPFGTQFLTQGERSEAKLDERPQFECGYVYLFVTISRAQYFFNQHLVTGFIKEISLVIF